MKFSSRIDSAIRLASRLHRDQTRVDAGRSPYISHLASVAMILSEVTEDEDIIISGLMHDSLEDVEGYTYEKLVADCGKKVAYIVSFVTESNSLNTGTPMSWMTRKEGYLKKLKEGGKESALVSAADGIHNLSNYILQTKENGQEFLKKFENSSDKNRIWFNEERIKVIEEKLGSDHVLVNEFKKIAKEFKDLVGETDK
ncbi:MAG: hypothetical protein JWN37_580 [Candidatus Nomurabacteria bacterium]|nr:hypothetical protein [Candidatus Nomurabacteria bacterium]